MDGMKMGVRFPDDESIETVQVILGYESVVRDQTVGRTFFELLMEGADVGSYPEEVQERLREIAARAADETAAEHLAPAEGGRPAGRALRGRRGDQGDARP